MPPSSLLPERQLVFSPELAATIGLEEAILLQYLQLCLEHQRPQNRRGLAFYQVERDTLLRALPFWQVEDLHRVARNLADKGVLIIESPPLLTAQHLEFALNEPAHHEQPAAPPSAYATGQPTAQAAPYQNSQPPRQTPSAPAATPAGAAPVATRRSAGLLPAHWSPSEDMLQLLSLNHNIPRQFALDQLEDFILYWRERGETSHAWENKFRQHVVSSWRHQQQRLREKQHFQVSGETVLDKHWRPSEDAMEIMLRGGIDPTFIEEAIPEFILYWRERGAAPRELNTRFIQHIRIQWAKYTSAITHSTEPRRMTDNWQPTADVYDILGLSHIDTEFARSLLPEFIVYWKDSNQVQTSWNSKFLQHVKYHWAKRHQLQQTDKTHAGNQGPGATGRTRDRSLEDDLSDTSWAK